MPACTTPPPKPAPTITLQQCQTVRRCTLPAMSPRTNGDLDDALTIARAAWASCAAIVDMVFNCQQKGTKGSEAHD
ncbi:Rz1-like lysis system protein LysC [Paraburkholderia guartelaensis]|uniref:Rz1-like lysis system protein LysC n=1 Tax=Paraburkholderia guartelaensis TaxID=2546446 RepID=UPI002AB60383|nr:Rz1-like lysis system protein LysC [Paraburkholderia guartelaensis]